MRQKKVVPMVEGGILAAVAIVFALISAYVPVIGAFVNLIWPVPIILLGVRHGYKWSIMATLVAGTIIAMVMHPIQAVSVVVGFGLIGIVLGYALNAGFSPVKTLIWGSISSAISKVAVIAIGIYVMGVNPFEMDPAVMQEALTEVLEIYRTIGIKEDDIATMASTMQQVLDMVKVVLPAGFAIASIVDTYINFLVAKIVLKRLGHNIKPFPVFKEWQMPIYVLWASIFSVALIAIGNSQAIPLITNIGINLQYFSSTLLLVQGLALFYFLADKYNLPRVGRGIILFMIFSNGIFTLGITMAGVFDMAFDYRKLRNK